MKLHYTDILTKIDEKPLWWDSRGVPRYCEFHPDVCPNLYADEVVLIRIACQNCRTQFDVQCEWDVSMQEIPRFSEQPTQIFYGDPPHNRCCVVGPSMLSISLSTIQFWVRNKKRSWVRKTDLENLTIEKLSDYEDI